VPGITGIITKNRIGSEKEIVAAMLSCLLHETFYTNGTYHNQKNGFYIGYASIENSFADCMPIFNETKDIVLFLTGECYEDQPLISTLAKQGHSFKPGNASYLVHRYEEEGEELFKNLNGWFNGVIYDSRNSNIVLFNDRFGIRRIYFYENNNVFAFSSEAKSLLKVFPELREFSLQSVAEFLTYDCVLENRTYFPKINLLPACSAWTFHEGHISKQSYMDMAELENQPGSQLEKFTEELATTFGRVLPRYFAGGLIGMGLTGGLDTRSIMACRNAPPGQLPCYTFGGTYRDIFDMRIAPKVAAVCRQPHTALRLDDDKLLKDYPSLVEKATYISDGLEGTDKVDVINFNRMARTIAPVRMTGKYGSQVLKGIFGFDARPPYMNIIDPDFKKYFDMAIRANAELQKGNKLTFLLQSAIPWWWNAFVTLESSQIEVRSPFLDNDLIKVLYKAPPLPTSFGIEFELNLIAKNKTELMRIPTTGTYGGNLHWPIPGVIKNSIKLLMNIDKVYIRERLPCNMTHVIARMDKLLISPLHLDRLVMGFGDFRRYRSWFQDQLAGYLHDVLLSEKSLNRPYWDRKNLIKIVNDHIHGRGTYLREIRKALQVELAHRVLLERL
jgi:asparagine synthase (glutamine-hydrolysing)